MREKLPFLIGAVVVVVLGIIFFFFGRYIPLSTSSVATNSQSPAVVVPFTKIVEGVQSKVATRANYLITSPSELNELWKMIDATSTPPAIDFKTQAVVAVFAGSEPSSSISVAKIEDADARMVSIAIERPDGACVKKQSKTSPYEVVAVPVTSLPFSHEDLSTTVSCPK